MFQGKPEWWKGTEWHEARACVSFPRSVLQSPRTPARKTHKKDFCSERRIHLVDQFGLKLCSFLCKLVQKVRACFWRRGNPKIYVVGCHIIRWSNEWISAFEDKTEILELIFFSFLCQWNPNVCSVEPQTNREISCKCLFWDSNLNCW